MILKRKLEEALRQWCQSNKRKPLLIRGARQVGKSCLVESFGAQHFANVVVINFELAPQYKDCFSSLDPDEICDSLRVMTRQSIVPGETLLFLDEIQECPQAIMALRYFKELMPALHVVGAGSLLELALKQAKFRMPVGRVAFLYLYPLSFKEFLVNFNPEAIVFIENATLAKPIPIALHQHLLKQMNLYMVLGGLPEVLVDYIENRNFENIQSIQASILETYQQDFGHYSAEAELHYLQKCFTRIPMMLGQQIKYNKIDPDLRSRELKQALAALESAAVLLRIRASSAKGLPLEATVNEKKFKMNFVDVGLAVKLNQLDAKIILNEDIMLLNRGAIAEQFVGQELLAYAPNYEKVKNYFWARDGQGTAEVDFLKVVDSTIYPLEVKAGKLGKLRSLKQYFQENNGPLGIRVSKNPLSVQEKVLSVPLYMISEIERLVHESLSKV